MGSGLGAPESPRNTLRGFIDSHHHVGKVGEDFYGHEEYLADARSFDAQFMGSVAVEAVSLSPVAADRSLLAIEEAAYVGRLADRMANSSKGPGGVKGFVGYADLGMDQRLVTDHLDRLQAHAQGVLRGVRLVTIEASGPEERAIFGNPALPGILNSEPFGKALTEVSARGLSLDVGILHHQWRDVLRLAREHPDLLFVIDHMASVVLAGCSKNVAAQRLQEWREAMIGLARQDNVRCKIGGLGMRAWGFSPDLEAAPEQQWVSSWRPMLSQAIEAFGVQRCMLESNFPVDSRVLGYSELWSTFGACLAGYSDDERAWLHYRTAQEAYRLMP